VTNFKEIEVVELIEVMRRCLIARQRIPGRYLYEKYTQARNQRDEAPLENFSPHLQNVLDIM